MQLDILSSSERFLILLYILRETKKRELQSKVHCNSFGRDYLQKVWKMNI